MTSSLHTSVKIPLLCCCFSMNHKFDLVLGKWLHHNGTWMCGSNYDKFGILSSDVRWPSTAAM